MHVTCFNPNILGMQYHTATSLENDWTTYWFEKNLQGDVVGVYNSSGTKLVSYTYDAFNDLYNDTFGKYKQLKWRW